MARTLFIFDVDGTLVSGPSNDDELFVSALARALPSCAGMGTDWSHYKYSTDSGVFEEIFVSVRGRRPSAIEYDEVRAHYLESLRETLAADPTCVREVSGAAALLRALSDIPQCTVAIASGAWRDSALMKLDHVGISAAGLTAAFAEDALDRSAIIQRVVDTSLARDRTSYERIFYVGDRDWDATAAARLGYGFIGIGGAFSTEEKSGIVHSFDDLSDASAVLQLLAQSAQRI